MKKVLIFSLVYYPKHVGGAEVAIKEITDRIDPSEIEFHMVTLRMDSTLPAVEKVGNILVHRIGFAKPNPTMADLRKFPLHLNKFLFQFAAPFKAASLERKYSYDAIWGMMAHSTGVPAGLFKTFFPTVPYILTLQEGDPIPHIEKTMRPLWPLFVRGFSKADVIQPISTFLGKWAESRGFKGKLEIIPNAVDTKKFSQTYSESELAPIRDALGKKDGDIFLITTSRLVHKNAVDDVIKSLKDLPAHIHFAILGIGPDEVMLRELVRTEGVENRVHFLGQIGHTDLPKYLKACDIFIRPSRSEGMGNSFVEAMAAGLPVIATQEGGIADFLFDPERNPEKQSTGFAVDANSPEQIAERVRWILEHPIEVSAIGATARKMAFEKYDWDLIATDMRKRVFLPLLTRK